MSPDDQPSRHPPRRSWPHYGLYARVRDAIAALPSHFRTETVIAGVVATDLFTLNQVIGASVEEQVVATLNAMRPVWDPDGKYALYAFERQAQTFPDVRLRCHSPASPRRPAVLMGIELKAWYLLAKEGEPSFRYTVTPAACNPQDLLVVVPWALSNVVSGSPVLFEPYIEQARYAAEYRNYHWARVRRAKTDSAIVSPECVCPYPSKSDQIADRPLSDAGGNFGRLARTRVMDEYLHRANKLPLCGIEAHYWRSFFSAFEEQATSEAVDNAINKLVRELRGGVELDTVLLSRVETILGALREIALRATD
jgi:hypothetical protein